MNKKTAKVFKAAAGICAAVIVVLYLINQVILVTGDSYTTEIAFNSTVYKTVKASSCVFRSEQYVTSEQTGTFVTMAQDGERVAQGDAIAMVFGSEQAASDYLRSRALRTQIERCKELSGQINTQAMDISSINSQIENRIGRLLDMVDSGSFATVESRVSDVSDSITTLQLSTGTVFDFSERISQLQTELDALENSSAQGRDTVTAPITGTYSSSVDGYVEKIDYNSIDDFDLQELESVIGSSPDAVAGDVRGKLITEFNWYIACEVEAQRFEGYAQGDVIYVNFPSAGIERLPAAIYRLDEKGATNTLLVLKCSLWRDGCDKLRFPEAEIIIEEYAG